MVLVKFGGFIPEPPVGYKVTESDIDSASSGRLEKGKMQRDRIRGGDDPVYKLQISWEKLTDEQMRGLLDSVKGASTSVEFYFGTMLTRDMYVGDRSIELKSDADGCLWDVNFNMTGN